MCLPQARDSVRHICEFSIWQRRGKGKGKEKKAKEREGKGKGRERKGKEGRTEGEEGERMRLGSDGWTKILRGRGRQGETQSFSII